MIESKNLQKHWDLAYQKNDINKLGWYELESKQSLDLINKCKLSKDANVLDVGSGASTLILSLLESGYGNLIATDLSKAALDHAKSNVPEKYMDKVKWIVADITDSSIDLQSNHIDLWHDRAVLHFLTQDNQKKQYAQTLNRVVKPGGFVLISAFAIGGATKCNGLTIVNYDQNMLSKLLGKNFELLEFFLHDYKTPSGSVRKYIYTRFQKHNNQK